MGKSIAFAGRTGMFLMVCVAAIVSLTSCADTSAHTRELQKRGFTDVAYSDGGYDKTMYDVSVGQCRLRLVYDSVKKSWTAQDGTGKVLLQEPSAAMVRSDPQFSYCSHLTPQPSPTLPPKG